MKKEKGSCRVWLKDLLVMILILKVFLLFFSFVLHFFESLNPIEKALAEIEFSDLYYKQDHRERIPEENKILIVNTGSLSNNTQVEFRNDLANVISRIDSCTPSVLACDMIFKGNSNDAIADQWLLQSLSSCRNLVLGSESSNANPALTASLLNSISGNLELNGDSLAVIRTYKLNHSFAYAVAKQANVNLNTELNGAIEDSLIEIDYHYHSYLYNNLSDSSTVRNPHFFDLVEAGELVNMSSYQLKELMKNRIVLIAHVGSGNAGNRFDVEDRHLTPHGNEDIIHRASVTPGVFIHAEVIQMLLNNRFAHPINKWMKILIENLILVLVALLYLRISLTSIWFKPIVVPFAFAMSFLLIFISLQFRDHLILWQVGFLNLQLIVLIEVLEFYEPIALWMKKKWKFNTVFKHHD